MSDEQKGRSNSLLAELLSVVLDVDDDDRDIIRVVIGITNESAVPISNIDSSIDTIGKGSYTAERSVSSIGPGLTRNFHFILGADLGHWVFNLSHGNGPNKDSLEIGPVRADLRIGEMLEEEVELAGSSIGGGIGGGLIADVFSEALGDFGNLRETIEIKMEFEATPESSSRELENEDEIVQNNTTKIELKPASPISKSWEEVPSSPPPKPSMSPPPKPSMSPQKTVESQDPLLSPDILNKISPTSSGLTTKSEENARAPPPTQGNRVHEAPPTSPARTLSPVNAHSNSSPSVREAPPAGPPSGPPASTPPAGPPSGPPASTPPAGPPSGPPASTPPAGPPSGPPASTPPAIAPPKSAFKKPTSGPPS